MILKETAASSGLSYALFFDDGKLLREISITGCSVEVENRRVRLIYNTRFEPIEPMCRFLLKKYEDAPENTIKQAMSALKVLAAYEEATSRAFEQFDDGQAQSFLLFLRGAHKRGLILSYDLKTTRSENTIGAYLKVYRGYARFLGLTSSPFLANFKRFDGSSNYRISASDADSLETPPFITVEEFCDVLNIIDASFGLEEKCIVRLMFEHGLRIGEVLGLTIEDIEATKNRHGIMKYYLYIRDRLSDTDDRHAKTVMKVHFENDYKRPGYNKRNIGYQRVGISESLYHSIIEYIETEHGHASGKYALRRDATARADSVKGEEDNYYLFLNGLGRPLKDDTWNAWLRSIFIEAGISIDEKVRRNGLNHRFRHGYAMVLRHIMKLDDYAVMVLMRHKSLLSTQSYDNPTSDQIAEMQENVIERWAEEIIPCLKA